MMGDLKHDLNVLVLVAKNDAAASVHRGELARIPDKLARAEREQAAVEAAEKKSIDDFETKTKERRQLEAVLQDNEAKIIKIKHQLMSAQSNKEYQAFTKEIETLKGNIDTEEERLLELMDALDDHQTDHEAELERLATARKEKQNVIDDLKQRTASLEDQVAGFSAETPKYLAEIEPPLKKKYERILTSLGSLAATRIENGNCGGCGTKLPPQLVVEVRGNDKLITCQACGRILIYYVD
jgi:predicted  nucleic acid-binding Zn-ribbon protein